MRLASGMSRDPYPVSRRSPQTRFPSTAGSGAIRCRPYRSSTRLEKWSVSYLVFGVCVPGTLQLHVVTRVERKHSRVAIYVCTIAILLYTQLLNCALSTVTAQDSIVAKCSTHTATITPSKHYSARFKISIIVFYIRNLQLDLFSY